MNNPINYKCPICLKYPNSHSFQFIGEYKSNIVIYTCPEKALRYNDHDGIISHYNGVLKDIQGKKWIWLFDARNFSAKHYLQFNISIDLAKLISKTEYSDNLQYILIYKPTWHLDLTLNLIYPFISEKMKAIIRKIDKLPTFLSDNPTLI
jgi:hypothetical protein